MENKKNIEALGSNVGFWMDDTANHIYANYFSKQYRASSTVVVGQGRTTSGNAVFCAQIALYIMGYFPHTIDGLFGPKTKQAIINYQRNSSWGLTADGLCGHQTWKNLNDQINN